MGFFKNSSDEANCRLANLPYKNWKVGSVHDVCENTIYIKSAIKQSDGVEAYVVVPKK